MPNQAKAQAGTISFVPQPDAANGLRRMSVQWSGFAPSQQISNLRVVANVESSDLIHLDRDAMSVQTLGIPGSVVVSSNQSYSDGGFSSEIRVTNSSFNTSTLLNPCTLFTFDYTGTPDCVTPIDTFIQFSIGISAYFGPAFTPIPFVQSSSDIQSFPCNFIRGVITTPFGDTPCEDNINGGIPGVNVKGFFRPSGLSSASNPVEVTLDTDHTYDDGYYLLDDMPSGIYASVRPSKLDNEACGITDFDLIEMRKYILGIPSDIWQYPWQIIAADADYSGSLSTQDISIASRWMLGIPFPPDWSGPLPRPWTFVPTGVYSGFTPPSGGSPFGYPYSEEISYTPLNQNKPDQDYFGIKRGDIDGSCNQCGDPFTAQHEDRSIEAQALPVILSDRAVQAGELIALPVSLDAPEPLNVVVLKIKADPSHFDIEGLHAAGLPFMDKSAVYATNEGSMRLAWFNPERAPVPMERFKNMFYVLLRAKRSLPSIQSSISVTDFEGNFVKGDSPTLYSPELHWVNGQSSVPIYQIGPNPFDAQFGFTVESTQDTDIHLRILSPSGAEIYRHHGVVSKGRRRIDIDGSAWPAGIYLYEMRYGSEHRAGHLVKQ